MIKSILIVYGIVAVTAVILYIPKLIQMFYAFSKPRHIQAARKRKISVVVPARNESKTISALFDSVLKQTYDKNFFDVNVIVKDPDDPTIELAKTIGANVFVVTEQTCKGAALDGYFKQLSEEKFQSYDAFVIVDADAVLAENYVEELNNALEHDYDIYLSRKLIKNYFGSKKARSIYCNCSALTYPMIDDLSNTYRTKKRIPLNMCGQGMMVRKNVIEAIGGWPYRTLTEDYELRMDSFLKGLTSMYYPYAVIYTEEVIRHKESCVRRLRWVTGFSQCGKMYKKQIWKQAKARGHMTFGEFEFFFSLYPVIIFIVATFATAAVGAVFAVIYATRGDPIWALCVGYLVLLPLGIIYVIVLLYSLLAMIAYRDAFCQITFGERLATLFFAPFFFLEYFPVFIRGLFCARSKLDWAPTNRVDFS